VIDEVWNTPILANMSVTNVLRCIAGNAKTFGLKHLLCPDTRTGSGPADGACVVHYWVDELL